MSIDPAEIAAGWRRAYARQSLSDFNVYDLLCATETVDECQRMHYLQMALEKAAKAHFWHSTAAHALSSKVNRSHKVAEKYLPLVMSQYWARVRPGVPMSGNLKKAIRLLCKEVDLLAPAVLDGESRRDNCEYPWEVHDDHGEVVGVQSPLDHVFSPSDMVKNPGAGTFLKAIRTLMTEVAQ